MLPYQMIAGGRFQLTTALIASGLNVECPGQNPPDFIVAKSITGWGESGDAQAIEWWWEKSMGNGFANGVLQASEASTPQLPAMTAYRLPATGSTAVDAISFFNTSSPPTYASLANTTINATTFVVSMADTGSIAVGDIVRLYNQTGMQQVAGMDFQVTAVTANTSITLGMQATAVSASANTFAANSTAGFVLKFIPSRFYPRFRWIAGITRAAQAVVYFTVANDFTAGENVTLHIPPQASLTSNAWTPMNNKTARILSVTNSATESSIVLDLDTSGIAAAYRSPTSAQASAGVQKAPVVVPASSGVVPFAASATIPQQPPGTNLLDAFDNRNKYLIRFGAALWDVSSHTPDNLDVWMWQAYKYDNYSIGNS